MKKHYLLPIMLLILISSVSAITTTGLVSYYKADNSGSFTDAHSSNDGTISGATYTSSGKINGAYYSSATDESIDTNYQPTGVSDFTVNMWVKAVDWSTGTSSKTLINSWATGTATQWFSMRIYNTQAYWIVDYGGAYYKDITADLSSFTDDTDWVMITGTRDTSTAKINIYLNGNYIGQNSIAGATGSITTGNTLTLFERADLTNAELFNGYIDEISIWSVALNSTTIGELYNSGGGLAYPFTISANNPPTVTNTYPANSTHFNTENINFTALIYDADNDILTCKLYINDDLASTHSGITGTSTPANNTFEMTLSLTDGIYNYIIGCDDGEGEINSTKKYFIIDGTNPIFTELTLNGDSTIFNRLTGLNVNFNGYWTDTYMYAYNSTIKYPNGTLANTVNDTGLTGTKEYINYTLNMTSYPDGEYTKIDCGSDDHTANVWEPDNVETSNQGITIIKGDTWIKIDNTQGNMKSVSYDCESRVDRCGFSFEPNNNRRRWYFEVSSNKPLNYRGQLYEYPTFASSPMWVDFVTQSPRVQSITVEDITEYSAIIHIEMDRNNKERIDFNSIGGLNIVCEERNFLIYTPTPLYINKGLLILTKI